MIGRPRARSRQPDRTLVTGWFSFPGMGATAGDLLALDVSRTWLSDAGMSFDVALDRRVGPGVDWRRAPPAAYSHLLFVCGPFYARRRLLRVLPRSGATALARSAPLLRWVGLGCVDRIVLELLVRRFDRCHQIGLDLSMLGPKGSWHPFDALVQRDGADGPARADIALAHQASPVPVVGVLLVERPGHGDQAHHAAAEQAIEDLLAGRELAVVRIDTRLDRPNPGGLRTAAEVESLIARMDVVVTTRMHGAVLALKHGVPAVVVDTVPGGGKVSSQMSVLGWPHLLGAGTVDPGALSRALDACLEPEARDEALAAGQRGVALASAVRQDLMAALGASGASGA